MTSLGWGPELNGLLTLALSSGWVTFYAVLISIDVTIIVINVHFIDLVAGVARVIRIGAGMAGFAFNGTFATVID